ncbi:MAG: hypothetical protein P8M55_01495 [Gammaproteobacteria bacterium]|nr:hypothetical protein [Gammaproteobacteria bacterium]
MRNLLLISALLLFSFNGWADDEFPIEITCEIGSKVIFLSIAEEAEDSYYTILSVGNIKKMRNGRPSPESTRDYFFEEWKDKKIGFVSQYVLDDLIVLESEIFKPRNTPPGFTNFSINRLTGTGNFEGLYSPYSWITGNCYSGLKEYSEKKF